MASTLEALFSSYRTRILDADCFKNLNIALKGSTPIELQTFFESFSPVELHLQLLKIYAARTCSQYDIIIKESKAESKVISKSCLNSRLLFQSNSQLLDHKFLLPFLQTFSYSNRKKNIWNLGKYMPEKCIAQADSLFHAVVSTWGISMALPLLCRCSEKVIKQELPFVISLPIVFLMILARRLPYVALEYLESHSVRSQKAIKYIVRTTVPKSLDYCVRSYECMSKTMMKIILSKYSHVILESPSKWSNVLDKKLVHKILKPDHFEEFLSKQFIELDDMTMPSSLVSYFKLLNTTQVSAIMHKLIENKYGHPFDSNLDYWRKNMDILKLMNINDRNCIAVQLHAQTKGDDWVTLMTCDKSIDIIKDYLRFEADAQVRASLVKKLLDTVEINNDLKALEEICQFITVRYRNDKHVLQAFFEKVPDLSSLPDDKWSAVLALAHSFFDPRDWMTFGTSRLFTEALKRNPEKYLKLFIDMMPYFSVYHMNHDVLVNLKWELRSKCIDLVFTNDHVKSDDYSIQHCLEAFLPIISKWNEEMDAPIINPNVNTFVLGLLNSQDGCINGEALNFVRKKKNGFDYQLFVDSFLEKASSPEICQYYLSKRLSFTNVEDVANAMTKEIFQSGPFPYIRAIGKMKKMGYTKFLKYLAEKSKDVLTDPLQETSKYAIFLLSLTTSNIAEFFSIIDPLLPAVEKANCTTSTAEVQPDQLQQAKHQQCNYREIGLSFSHIDLPTLTVDRMLKFCTNGDLILFVRSALYSVCSSLPHDAAHKLILSLMNTPVSVQKHAIRLHQLVCNIQCQLDFLMNLLEKDCHISVRTIVVQSAMRCLNEARTVSAWNVTKKIISCLKPTDRAIVAWLVNANIPNSFAEEYFHIILEKVKLLKDDVIDIIASALQAICIKQAALSENFLESIIKEYFLSEWFRKDAVRHIQVLNLLMIYLKCDKDSSIRSELAHRQQFFVEILKTNANEAYLNNFDDKLCRYFGRLLFMNFIEIFCSECFQNAKHVTNETNLRLYINILLEYVNELDANAFFQSSLYLYFTQMGNNPPETIGQGVGQFCDSCLRTQPFLAQYALPHFVDTYFRDIYRVHLNASRIISVLTNILPTINNSAEEQTLRLVTIAHSLPSDWISSSLYEPFRQTFLPLVKNTATELVLLNR